MKISSTKRPSTRYVPEVAGNRNAKVGERVVFKLDPLTAPELEVARAPHLKGMTEGSDEDTTKATRAFRDELLRTKVLEIENLEGDGGPLTPETWVKAVEGCNDAELGGLPNEIFLALTKASKLREGVAGN